MLCWLLRSTAQLLRPEGLSACQVSRGSARRYMCRLVRQLQRCDIHLLIIRITSLLLLLKQLLELLMLPVLVPRMVLMCGR